MICTVGELMWDLYGEPGAPLAAAANYRRVLGGASANVAFELRALNLDVAVAGVVADDVFGRAIHAALSARGVDVSALEAVAGRSGVVFIESRPEAEASSDAMRCVSYQPSLAHPDILPTPGSLSAPGSCEALHIGSLRPDRRRLVAYRRLARKLDTFVLVDLNARPRAWSGATHGRELRALLRRAHAIKASLLDLSVLGFAGDSLAAIDAARHELAPQATWIVTRADRPTWLRGPWGTATMRPPRVALRRHVGAGDAFCSGVLAAIVEGGAPDQEQHAEEVWRHLVSCGQAHAAHYLARM